MDESLLLFVVLSPDKFVGKRHLRGGRPTDRGPRDTVLSFSQKSRISLVQPRY